MRQKERRSGAADAGADDHRARTIGSTVSRRAGHRRSSIASAGPCSMLARQWRPPALRTLALAALAAGAIHCKTSNTTPADAAVAAADAAHEAAAPVYPNLFAATAGRRHRRRPRRTRQAPLREVLRLLPRRERPGLQGRPGAGARERRLSRARHRRFSPRRDRQGPPQHDDELVGHRARRSAARRRRAGGHRLPALVAEATCRGLTDTRDERQGRGRTAIYTAQCATCHGTKGRDGKYNALSNPELLASASNGFLATTIERGARRYPDARLSPPSSRRPRSTTSSPCSAAGNAIPTSCPSSLRPPGTWAPS